MLKIFRDIYERIALLENNNIGYEIRLENLEKELKKQSKTATKTKKKVAKKNEK